MLFCNIDLLDENFECKRGQYVGVKDGNELPTSVMPSRRRITASVTTANTVC